MFWVLFGRLRPHYDLRWRSTLKEFSLSRRGNWFSYINHLNPSSYAKVTANTVWTGQRPKYYAWHQTHVDDCLMQCVSNSALKKTWIEKPSTQESFVSSSRSIFIYNSSQSEVVWDLGRQIKIRLCFWSSENSLVEWKLTFRVKTYRSSKRSIE